MQQVVVALLFILAVLVRERWARTAAASPMTDRVLLGLVIGTVVMMFIATAVFSFLTALFLAALGLFAREIFPIIRDFVLSVMRTAAREGSQRVGGLLGRLVLPAAGLALICFKPVLVSYLLVLAIMYYGVSIMLRGTRSSAGHQRRRQSDARH